MSFSSKFQRFHEALPLTVHLLAVSKGHSVSSISSLAELGQLDFGESRVQEALPKLDALQKNSQLRWHFIGRLQTNKVRKVVKSFDFIHSVDSFDLAQRISRIAIEEKRFPKIMFQVKFREDPTKSGFAPEQICEAWPKLMNLQNIQLVGLMTMAPKNLDLDERRTLFQECRALADQLNLPECSMGMSSDWEEAISAGATWIRIGSALFGSQHN